ncbi:hypothetical protein BDN70DRAFT_924162 [Pholiota conissans]|uniref:Uncharacterized protein n=1 Tax=Pholiota conissans TaxID=109636 RepID=A0A9P6CX26_9AGAR|nr:hypothetical protein BDN70DRAFT_924162 [Pholiota conissans]
MRFSFKHALFLNFGVLTLLQSVIARPVLLPCDKDLIQCDGAHGSKLFVRSDLEHLLDQATHYHHGPTQLTLGKYASKELDKLGLHGKVRKNTINWHKKQMKKAMRTHPLLKGVAQKGEIVHIAHKGGSNPSEKNHITATFLNKEGSEIMNDFNGESKHHIYVNSDNKGLSSHVKGAMDGANARITHKSRDHQVASGKTRTRGKSRGKGKGQNNRNRNFSKNPHKGYKRRGGK